MEGFTYNDKAEQRESIQKLLKIFSLIFNI